MLNLCRADKEQIEAMQLDEKPQIVDFNIEEKPKDKKESQEEFKDVVKEEK